MSKYEMLQQNPSASKRLFGLKMEQIDMLLEKVQEIIDSHREQHPLSNRGAKSSMPLGDQLLPAPGYLKSYPTFVTLGFSYGISESWACKIYHRIRPMLCEAVGLKTNGKPGYNKVKSVVIDVAVHPIERPVKGQGKYYNGYKKHIVKVQIIDNQHIDRAGHCHVQMEGRQADITVFRESGVEMDAEIKKKADLAYEGLVNEVDNFRVPFKKPEDGGLTDAQKKRNKRLRRKRIKVEHTIRRCRLWRITKHVYRNKLRHTGQVWLIVCGLVNFSSS